MIDLVTPKPAVDGSWSVGDMGPKGKDMVEGMRADLEKWTYNLPPGYSVGEVCGDFEMVVLRFNLLVEVANGVCESVIANEGRLVKCLEADPTCCDAGALLLMAESVILKDFIRGIELGIRFSEIVEVKETVHMLLFPTIFECEEWMPDVDVNKLALKKRSGLVKIEMLGAFVKGRRARDWESLKEARRKVGADDKKGVKWSSVVNRTGLDKFLGDRVAVLGMARVELQIQKLLLKTPSDEDIVNKIYSDTKTKDFTISAHTNYVLQDALLTCGKFDEYFVNAVEICGVAGSAPFSRIMIRHVEVFGTAKLLQYIDGVYHKASQKIVTAITAGQQLALPPPGQPGADAANPVLTESLVSSIRCFRDGFLIVIKAAVVIAGLEMNDTEHYASVGRIFGVFAGYLGKLDSSLSELLKMVESVIGKLQTIIQFTKTAILNIRDGIVDVMKSWPKNVKGSGNAERIKALGPLHDEILRVGEKLNVFVIKLGMESHADTRRGAIS